MKDSFYNILKNFKIELIWINIKKYCIIISFEHFPNCKKKRILGNKKIYIQVSDNITDDKTLERETRALLKIKDAWMQLKIK